VELGATLIRVVPGRACKAPSIAPTAKISRVEEPLTAPSRAADSARHQLPPMATAPAPCTLVRTIGRGVDLGIPFLPTVPALVGGRQPTASVVGEVLAVARWVSQLITWALAAFFIADFTGIVRKPLTASGGQGSVGAASRTHPVTALTGMGGANVEHGIAPSGPEGR
jgi:hypothetical protein